MRFATWIQPSAPDGSGVRTLHWRDFAELFIGYALIIAAEWSPAPLQQALFWIGIAWAIAVPLSHRHDRTRLGLGVRGMLASSWIIVAALALFACAAFIAARASILHSAWGANPVFKHAFGYALWSLMQQFILQDYFLYRLLRMMHTRKTAILAAALLFALAHTPNPVLMIATFLWGYAACWLFLRYRNLYTLGIAHFIFGMMVAVCVPATMHHNMRVGAGYLRYRALSGTIRPTPYRRSHA